MKDKTQIRTECCVCGCVIKDGPTMGGHVSHGFCKGCLKEYRKQNGLDP